MEKINFFSNNEGNIFVPNNFLYDFLCAVINAEHEFPRRGNRDLNFWRDLQCMTQSGNHDAALKQFPEPNQNQNLFDKTI